MTVEQKDFKLDRGRGWFILFWFQMTELEKYRALAQRLKNQQQGPPQEAAEFYFRQLEKLDVDLLLADLEVNEQLRQITAIEAKIGSVKEEMRRKERDTPEQEVSSSEQVVGEYGCPLKDCGKHFQRQSGLRLHQHLVHGQPCNPSGPPVFSLSLDPSES